MLNLFKLFILIFIPAISLAGGVGTIVGGDKIVFQQDSIHVSSVYNRSLCFDRGNYYATIKNYCFKWKNVGRGERECVSKGSLNTTQPKESVKERCSRFQDDNCVEKKVVPFIQNRVRNVRYIRNDNEFIKKLKIPSCYK